MVENFRSNKLRNFNEFRALPHGNTDKQKFKNNYPFRRPKTSRSTNFQPRSHSVLHLEYTRIFTCQLRNFT